VQNIPFHPLAEIFPSIYGKEFVELKADIKANGLHEPIVMYEGKILDGRNRFRACQEVGVTPHFTDYTGDDPAKYVISLNLHRRHLDESQRGIVAAKIANLTKSDAATRSHDATANLQSHTRAEAADMLNVSERTVNTAKKVLNEGAPEPTRPGFQRANIAGCKFIATAPESATTDYFLDRAVAHLLAHVVSVKSSRKLVLRVVWVFGGSTACSPCQSFIIAASTISCCCGSSNSNIKFCVFFKASALSGLPFSFLYSVHSSSASWFILIVICCILINSPLLSCAAPQRRGTVCPGATG